MQTDTYRASYNLVVLFSGVKKSFPEKAISAPLYTYFTLVILSDLSLNLGKTPPYSKPSYMWPGIRNNNARMLRKW